MSASAHKFHGPKGVGFLYIREGVQIPSFIHGGSQEKGKRAGTENIAGIVGMGKAAELAAKGMRAGRYRETMLRNYLIEKIVHEIPDVRVNGHRTKRLPGNVSVSFKGVDGASLLILLDEDGICASGGSACNTGESRISYVIKRTWGAGGLCSRNGPDDTQQRYGSVGYRCGGRVLETQYR